MSPVDQALDLLLRWFKLAFAAFVKVFGIIEDFLHRAMVDAGIPASWQRAVLVVAAILLIVAVLKVFGGLLRILVILFLVLLLLHVLLPLLGV